MNKTVRSVRVIVDTHLGTMLCAGWMALALILLIFSLDSFVGPPRRDSSIFLYVAQGMLEGDVPYADRWDHKGPLIYLLSAVGLLISDLWGLWLLETCFLLLTVWVAYLVVRQFGTLPALVSLTVFLGYLCRFVEGGNFTEQYALLFQFLALYLFVREVRGDRRSWVYISIGILGSLTLLLRPNLIGVWVAIGLYWVLFHQVHSVRRILLSAAGAGLPVIAAVVAFEIFDGLYAFWDAVFTYNIQYSRISALDRLTAIWRLFGRVLPFAILPVAFSWFIGIYRRICARSSPREISRELVVLSVILLPIEVFFVSLSGNHYGHYYLAVLPVVTILIAYLMSEVTMSRSIPASLLSVVSLVCVGLYFIPPAANDSSFFARTDSNDSLSATSRQLRVADVIETETEPGETILVWGSEANLYLISGRSAPTRYFYQYPLVRSGYADPTIFDEFISEIGLRQPALLIDTRNRRLPPLDASERMGWQPSVPKYVYLPERFEPFFAVVDEQYELLAEIDGYFIYRASQARKS